MSATRFRSGSVLVALVLLAAACGTNDDPSAAGGGSAAPESNAGGGVASGDVTVWAMGAEGESLGQFASQFQEANADVNVDVTPIAWDVAHDKFVTSVAGNETPGAAQMGTTWMGEFAALGALQQTPGSLDASEFFEGAYNTNVVDGTAYGVPWYVETRVLYYRTDLLEQAGITEAPQTWDELKTAARALVEEAGTQRGLALLTGTGSWQQWLPLFWSAGGEIMDDQGNFTLDSPAAVEALEYYVSFFEEGLAEPVAEGFAPEQGFVAGTDPMFFSGPWHMQLIADTGGAEIEGKWDIALQPEKETATSFVGGSNLVVFSSADNPAAAWEFVEYMSEPDVQSRWYSEVGALPAVKSAWETGELASDEKLATFGEQLEDAKAPPAISTWEEIATAIDDEIEKAALGEKSAQEAAASMQQAAESIGTGE